MRPPWPLALALVVVTATPPAPAEAAGRTFTITAAGDILIQRAVAEAAEELVPGPGTWDFLPLLAPVEPWIADADLALCHLEGTLSPSDTGLLYDESGWPRFNAPREVATALAAAGFDACSLASNHAFDRDRRGVAETIEVLEDAGLAHSGTARNRDESRPALYWVRGVRVAHISYSTGTNFRPLPLDAPWAVNVLDVEAILDDARWAREQGAEFTIVSMHWGSEYWVDPDGPQLLVAAALTASPDVDVVIGHHSHMVQPITWMNGKPVVYGMGDNLSDIHGGSGHGPGAGDGFLLHLAVAERAGGGFAVTDLAVTPTWVDPATMRVLPIDHTLAYGGDPALAPALEAARALILERLGLLGEAVALTPTPWPSLACAGRAATRFGTSHTDLLLGTPGDDVLVGREGDDTIMGLGGNDVICGGGGADALWGGPGWDALYGGPGSDLLSGGEGRDRLFGGEGADRLGGGEDGDSLYGGGGDDALWGQGGDDLLAAGGGADLLAGGTGADLLLGSAACRILDAGPGDVCRVGSYPAPCPAG